MKEWKRERGRQRKRKEREDDREKGKLLGERSEIGIRILSKAMREDKKG